MASTFTLVPVEDTASPPKGGTFTLEPIEEPAAPQATPKKPFATGSVPDRMIQAIPDALVNNGVTRTMAGLGGGILNRAVGAIQGGTNLIGEGADILGYDKVAQAAQQVGQDAGTVSKGINQTVSSLPALGKGAAIAGDLGTLVAAGPQSLVGGAIAEGATRPDEQGGNITDRAINSGVNYLTGKILNVAAEPVVKYVGKALGMRTEKLTSDELKTMANDAYQRADQIGGTLKENVTNDFITNANNTLRPQTMAGKIISGDSISTKLADRIAELKDTPLSLQEAQEIDEHLGDVIDGLMENGRLTKEGKKVLDLQTTFRRTIDKASPNDIVGGTAGFDALKEGRMLWSKMAQLRDVEKVITRAEMMDNPATGIKTGFRTIVSNPARLRGYSPEVQKLMKSAAQTGVLPDTLRVLGSRLIPIAAASAGNIPGALLGHAASSLARSGATELQLNRANKVADAIVGPLNPARIALPPALPSIVAGEALSQSAHTDNSGQTRNISINGQPAGTFTMPTVSQTIIQKEEGSRPTSYLDTEGHRTVGTGFNMDAPNAKDLWKRAGVAESFDDVYAGKSAISPESEDKLFAVTQKGAERAAKKLVPNFSKLGENQQAALTSLVFQLGADGLSKFKRTLAYLQEGNGKAVENNLVNSLLGKQTPARTRRTALMLAYNLSHEEADRQLAEQGRIKPNERKYA